MTWNSWSFHTNPHAVLRFLCLSLTNVPCCVQSHLLLKKRLSLVSLLPSGIVLHRSHGQVFTLLGSHFYILVRAHLTTLNHWSHWTLTPHGLLPSFSPATTSFLPSGSIFQPLKVSSVSGITSVPYDGLFHSIFKVCTWGNMTCFMFYMFEEDVIKKAFLLWSIMIFWSLKIILGDWGDGSVGKVLVMQDKGLSLDYLYSWKCCVPETPEPETGWAGQSQKNLLARQPGYKYELQVQGETCLKK